MDSFPRIKSCDWVNPNHMTELILIVISSCQPMCFYSNKIVSALIGPINVSSGDPAIKRAWKSKRNLDNVVIMSSVKFSFYFDIFSIFIFQMATLLGLSVHRWIYWNCTSPVKVLRFNHNALLWATLSSVSICPY